MPRNVAGRKARCNSCGFIFTVPVPELNPERPHPLGAIPLEPAAEPSAPGLPSAPSRESAQASPDELGDWLDEFAEHEGAAASALPPALASDSTGSGPGSAGAGSPAEPASLLEFADKPDILAPPVATPHRRSMGPADSRADEDRSGVIEPTRSYWADLAGSFLFFLDAGSFITFVVIIIINLWTILLGHAGCLGWIGSIVVAGYLCTFYMAVIRDTAAGEDELPNIWIDDVVNDLLLSIARFVGTWLWVLIPAAISMLVGHFLTGEIPWTLAKILALVGVFFWPVVILGVALGGGFHGLWPHVIVRTALGAPLPYLAMCGILLMASAITTIPYSDTYKTVVNAVTTRTNAPISLLWTLTVLNSAAGVYAVILAMRIIGLYYRHFKRKFPWVAE